MDGIMDGSYMKFNIFKYYFSIKTLTICHLSVTSEYLHFSFYKEKEVDKRYECGYTWKYINQWMTMTG